MVDATYIEDYVPTVQLTGYARQVPSPANLILERFLPNRQLNSLEAAIDEVTKTNRAAKFRPWDVPVTIGKRDVFESRKLRIAALGQKLPVGEQEMLQLALLQTGGTDRRAMINAIYNDTDNNVRSIYNRLELARGDILTDGKMLIQDEGMSLEADFGVPTENLVTPSGALWDDAENGTPLSDLRAWVLYYAQLNGARPGFAVMSESTIAALAVNEEVRTAAASGNFLAPFVTDATLAGIFSTNRFPLIVPYDTIIEFDPGDNRRVLPENKVIFLPPDPSSLGFTAWGITAEALALANSSNPALTAEQAPGIVAVTTREGDPPRVWTKAGATAMPMLSGPRWLMVATVLS